MTNNKSKKYVVSFRGINCGEGHAEGEFSETKNISTAQFPCVAQRFARVGVGNYGAPTSMHAKEGLLVIDGTTAIYRGTHVGTVTAGRKQMATVGNYILIFPDKAYYNVETGEFGSMEASASAAGMVFTGSTIKASGVTFPFRVGDAVVISGCAVHPENNKTIIIRGVSGDTLTFYDNSFTAGTETGSITLKREVPELEFVCESNYRLWGTKGNTIYASKYGDPFNFNVFDGLTGDSYYIDVGSDGEFTGCVPFSSHICFFKENTLHKLYGSKPSNYQIVTAQVYGVQAGSERSIRCINETLYYKGVGGVYAYTGGVPELVSEKFGMRRFSEACAESDGSKYYISMREGNAWRVFVYDVLRGLWVQEDDTHCVDMAFHDGYVYFLTAGGQLLRVDGDSDRSDVAWSVTFCPFNETVNERKGYSKFHLRLEMAAGSSLAIEVKRDIDASWQLVYTAYSERARTISVPVVPARCDSVEIRISGKGECLLRTFVREFFTGSDV